MESDKVDYIIFLDIFMTKSIFPSLKFA